MAIITRAYSETDNTIAEASSVNKVIDDLYTLQSGQINSANAGTLGVGSGILKSGSVIIDKLDASVRFFHEVFS